MGKRKSRRAKLGKKLIQLALDEFYCFDDDEVEDELDVAINRFKGKRVDWRSAVRAYIFSKEHLRNRVCDIAVGMFG
jgi:hypothetical protein